MANKYRRNIIFEDQIICVDNAEILKQKGNDMNLITHCDS